LHITEFANVNVNVNLYSASSQKNSSNALDNNLLADMLWLPSFINRVCPMAYLEIVAIHSK